MSSETTIVVVKYRLKEWAAQVKDRQNRPADMSVADRRACNDITKVSYYYRLRCIRLACNERDAFAAGGSCATGTSATG